MEYFSLPSSTKVGKVIPKNAFDIYTTSKQKKLFTDLVSRISWLHKLSKETVNLSGNDIGEIQIFLIELKTQENITPLLDIIDKAIPYSIIFIVAVSDRFYVSTSIKHPSPQNENNAVVDFRYVSDWHEKSDNPFSVHLRKNLDWVFIDFCKQISPAPDSVNDVKSLATFMNELQGMEKTLSRLKAELSREKQFNLKVELNGKIKVLEEKIRGYTKG